jgi:soluble lytic murein transglycosylase-like protein
MLRLYRGAGFVEVPAALVVAFESGEEPEEAQPMEPEAAAPAPPAAPPATPQELVRAAAVQAGLPPEFVASVAQVESAFRPEAVSPKGAIGVMQLMPATAKALGADPYDVRQNIEAGTRLLRDLLLRYDGDVAKALAAYNAGARAVERHRGVPPFAETRRYVNKVIGVYRRATSAD